MREIPMAPSVTWDLICSQTPVMNWCGMTNTRILAPRTASVMSGIATWWTTRCTATFFFILFFIFIIFSMKHNR